MSYTLDSCNALIQFEQTLMRTVHVLAWDREQTRFATAFLAHFGILATHTVHIGGRCTDI